MSGYRWAVGAFALAGAVLIACGGGSKSGSPTAGAGASPATGTQSAAGATQADASGRKADPELQAVVDRFTASKFTATYTATGAEASTLSGGTLTLAKDGATKFRFDVITQQDGQDVSALFIQSETVSAFCLKDAGDVGSLLGIEPGQGVCFKTSQDDPANPVVSVQDLFKDIVDTDATIVEKSNRTIAGIDGKCYKTKSNADGTVSTKCFSDSGVMLYEQTEGEAASELEAQKVSGDVNDSDFTLPYEVRELPGDSSTP